MRWADLPNAVIAALCVALLLTGFQGVVAIEFRHVPGYPATGQWIQYVVIPALFVGMAAASALASRKLRWFYDLYPFAILLMAFLLMPVLLFWGGGV